MAITAELVQADDDLVVLPALTGRIVDTAHLLDQSTHVKIEAALSDLEKEKGSQVVVLTLPTTQPEDITAFGIRLAEDWKIGRKGVDDGVILIIVKDDRRVRIEVGYGLEGAIPDARAKQIIETFITPEFRAGNFAQGIKQGVNAIASLVKGEELAGVQQKQIRPLASIFIIIAILVFIFILDMYSPGLVEISNSEKIGSGSSRNSGRFGGFNSGGGGFGRGGGSFGGGGASGSW